MNKIEFIPHTADIALKISANSIEKLFRLAAEGWLISVYESQHKFNLGEKDIKLHEPSIEILLVEFLNELNYLLQVKKWIFHSIAEIEISKTGEDLFLSTIINGDFIEDKNLELKEEIKAVTYHNLEIKQTDDFFSTTIIFDI